MRLMRLTVLLVVPFLFSSSCSNLPLGEQKQEQIVQKQSDEDVHAQLNQRLSELILRAKSEGEDAVRFLANDLYLKASRAELEQDFLTAAFLYRHLNDLEPKGFLRFKLAAVTIQLGDMQKARDILEELRKSGEFDREKVGVLLAGVLGSLGDVKRARKLYRELLTKNPKFEDACLFYGKLEASEGRVPQALKLFNSCAKRMPDSPRFPFYIGKILLDQKKFSAAREYFFKARSISPDYAQAVYAIGITYEAQSKFDRALDLYRDYLKLHGSDEVVLSRVVQILSDAGKSHEVIPFAKELMELRPADLNLKFRLATLYTDQHDYAKAKELFRGILKEIPDSEKVRYYLAAIHQELKEFDDALEHFGEIDEESALYVDSTIQMARILAHQALSNAGSVRDRKEKLLLEFNEERSKHPKVRVELAIVLANYLEESGNNDAAIAALSSVQFDPLFSEGHAYYLASLYEQDKRYIESRGIIQRILDTDPKNAHAWNFIGYSLLERGEELAKARKYIKKAATLRPNDAYIIDSLGWYYYKTGDLNRAHKELKRAAKLVNDDATINKHLGIVSMELRLYNDAKKYFMRALDVSTRDPERRELFQLIEALNGVRRPASVEPTSP